MNYIICSEGSVSNRYGISSRHCINFPRRRWNQVAWGLIITLKACQLKRKIKAMNGKQIISPKKRKYKFTKLIACLRQISGRIRTQFDGVTWQQRCLECRWLIHYSFWRFGIEGELRQSENWTFDWLRPQSRRTISFLLSFQGNRQ